MTINYLKGNGMEPHEPQTSYTITSYHVYDIGKYYVLALLVLVQVEMRNRPGNTANPQPSIGEYTAKIDHHLPPGFSQLRGENEGNKIQVNSAAPKGGN